MMSTILSFSLLLAGTIALVPTIDLEPGVAFPMVGLGTWQYNDSVAEAAVSTALKLGYTHIDTAWGYKNQVGVGKAIGQSGRTRESLFITSKVPGGLTYAEVTANLQESLDQLGLEQVDLVLTHFPATWGGDGGRQLRQEGWRALEDWKKAGKTRAIGVSHYCRTHIDDILAINTTAVAMNQVEYHIGMGDADVNATDDIEYFRQLGITYMSFSTLCGPCGTSELINGPVVTAIGEKYGKSGAQVSLRWAVQQGIPVVPKSGSATHQRDNLDLFSWSLTEEDMATLTAASSPPVCGAGDNATSGDCVVV